MDDGLFRAASAMMLESRRQESIARNLAGGSINGFKRDFVVSESFKSMVEAEAGKSGTGGLLGPSPGKSYVDFSSGTISRTDRRLDFAIEGYTQQSTDPEDKGEIFFEVQSPDGKALYTRNGGFFLNSDNSLVTAEGYIVSSDGGAITLGADDDIQNLCVTSDGEVRLQDTTTNPSTIKTLGTLRIVKALDPQSLTRLSACYFSDLGGKAGVTEADPSLFKVMNGYLEESNTSPADDMTQMIQSSREYEMNSKVIKMLEDRFRQEQSKLGK